MSNSIFKDPNAFKEVFKEYFNPLCNFVFQQVRNWEDSREIVQTTFLKIWENKDRIKVHSSVQSYLYQSVKNTMIDHIRKSNKIDEQKQMIGDQHKGDLTSTNGIGLEPYIVRQKILRAMQKLKPKNRQIFELHKFEGLTYKEIAEYMNISERSVEDNVARALRILREELKGKIEYV